MICVILYFSLFLKVNYGQDESDESVEVKVFYESLCPDSRLFFTKTLVPAVQKLPDNLEVFTYAYGKSQTIEQEKGKYMIACKHGSKECYGNKLHACAIELIDDYVESLLFISCMMSGDTPGCSSDNQAVEYTEIVHVKVFTSCFCPAVRSFVTQTLAPKLRKIPENLEVVIIPYGFTKTVAKHVSNVFGYIGPTLFKCPYGEKECYGNKLHACAIEVIKYINDATLFIACTMDKDRKLRGSDDEAVEYCGKQMKQDYNEIVACAKSRRSEELLWYAWEDTKYYLPEFNRIPYFLINGKDFDADPDQFWLLICKEFEDPPEECKQILT